MEVVNLTTAPIFSFGAILGAIFYILGAIFALDMKEYCQARNAERRMNTKKKPQTVLVQGFEKWWRWGELNPCEKSL